MSNRKLEKLRRRAFEARIRGSSKMDEHQLLAALEQAGHASSLRALMNSLSVRRGVTP